MPKLPQIFTARVESRDPIPELDRGGRYRYRQYPDSNQAPHAEASAFTRRLQPYAGPSDGMPFGWHLPLHDDNEVLISCLNRDPDQPMLVGTLSNPAHGSVVTAENAAQNLLHTAGGNQLAMDDWRNKSAITLCTFAGHTMLHFNADVAGHRINLETGLGRMEYYAKKTIATTSGDTLTETVGNDRIQQIENRQSTTTNTKEIHHQAKTNGQITAADNIQMESGKNIEMKAGQDLHLDITEATRIQVHEQDAVIHIDSGSLTVTADGAIAIRGDGKGTMYFCQNGGGLAIAPNGDITLFGRNIDIESRSVNFIGNVRKEVTAPPEAPEAVAVEPLAIDIIPHLYDEAENHSLQSDFAYEQLRGVAKLMEEKPFITWLAHIFGYDIPVRAYVDFRRDLLNGSLPQPEIRVLSSKYTTIQAAYDFNAQIILVGLNLIEAAARDNDAAWKLNIALSEEYGHHVDYLLRNTYSDVGGDGYLDEGARYSYNLINYKADLQSVMPYATHTGNGGNYQLFVEYPGASAALNRYLSVECRYDIDTKDSYENFVCAQTAGDRGPGFSFGHESIEDVLLKVDFGDYERDLIFFGNWTRDYNQLVCPQLLKTPGNPPGLGMSDSRVSSGDTFPVFGPVLFNFDVGRFAGAFKEKLADGFLSREALTQIINALAEAKFVDSEKYPKVSVSEQRQIFKVTPERLGVYRPEEHQDNPAGLEDGRGKDPDLRGPVLPQDLEIDPETGMKRYLTSPGCGCRDKDPAFRGPVLPKDYEIDPATDVKHDIGQPACGSSLDFIEVYFTEAIRLGRNPDGLRYFGMGLHILEDFFCHTNVVEICLHKLGYTGVVLWVNPEPADRIPMTSGIFGFVDTVVSILYEISHHLTQATDCEHPWERSTGQKIALIIMRENNLAWGQRLDDLWTSLENIKEDHPDFFQGVCKSREFLFGWVSSTMGYLLQQISGLIDDIQTFADSEGVEEPTHSQMSKDHDDHPLHVLAAKLAMAAVDEVGRVMRQAYDGSASLTDVMAIVRKMMTHPQQTQWMDTIVKEWADAHPDDIVRAGDRRRLGEQAQKRYQDVKDDTRKMIEEARKQAQIMKENDQWMEDLEQKTQQLTQQAQQQYGQRINDIQDNWQQRVQMLKNQIKSHFHDLSQQLWQLGEQVQADYSALLPRADQLDMAKLNQYKALTKKIPAMNQLINTQYRSLLSKASQLSEQARFEYETFSQTVQKKYAVLCQEMQQLRLQIKTKYNSLVKELPELKNDTIHDYKILRKDTKKVKGILLNEIHDIRDIFSKSFINHDESSNYHDQILEYYQGDSNK